MNNKNVQCRISCDLYKAIKKEQIMLSNELGKPISFSKASKIWFKRTKGSDFQIIKF